jgi:signal transduction histidine kinase
VSASVVVASALGAGAAVVLGLILRASLDRVRSLRRQVLLVTLASLLAGAVVAFVLAQRMVLEPGEAWRAVGVLGLTAGYAAVLVLVASAPLGEDVRRLEATARAIEAGDRTVRTGVARSDELGHVAAALDDAIARLGSLERARADDDARRNEMFSAIGHDLRTPLSALRAALEALEDGLTPDPDRYLRAMQHDVAALASLVDDLFLLSRIESGAIEPARATVDLTEIAGEAVEALTPTAVGAGVDIELRSSEPVPTRGNAVALGRVVRNLVDNAVRHSPRGSTVLVVVERDPRPLVRVVDAGTGFPDGFRARAFERFSRADASRSRTTGGGGLGLAIAHGLVTAHGGEIWIDPPADGVGGSVAFALPVPG